MVQYNQPNEKGGYAVGKMILTAPDDEKVFFVVHPLDDIHEEKVDIEELGPMKMSWSVRLSLLALRGYLFLMAMLVLYKVLELSGTLRH